MKRSVLKLLCVISVLALSVPTARALIFGSAGNDPIEDHGWPAGSVTLANLESRVAFWEGPPFGGGQYTFEFRGESTAEFNKALALFARIDSPRKELIVQSGPTVSFWLGIAAKENQDLDPRADWTFVIWNADRWNALYNDPDNTFLADHPNFRKAVDPPRMFLFLGGGTVDWEEVILPAGVTVINQRGKPGEGPSITGFVTDMDSGDPVAGARVALFSGTQKVEEPLPATATDADGRFVLSGFPSGAYAVVASHEGYATKRSLAFGELRGSDTREEDLKLSQAVDISGIVRGSGGEALAGARVTATNVIGTDGFGYRAPETIATTTGVDGRFTLVGLPNGECRLQVWIEGHYYPGSVTTKHRLPGDGPVNLSMIGTGTVRGTLERLRSASGQLNVSIHPPEGNQVGSWGGSMNCGTDGTFIFRNVPVGDYLVGPSTSGLELQASNPAVRSITVLRGETVVVELRD